MKKLTRKLFLSVAALAVCAATLVSTTFAWYVNSPTANLNAVEGSTAQASAGASLSVSVDGKAKSWKSAVTPALEGNNVELEPIQASANAKDFSRIDGSSTLPYLTWSFWIKSDADTTATIVTTFNNTTKNIPTQTNYTMLATNEEGVATETVGDWGTTGSTAGNQMTIDAIKALRLGIAYQENDGPWDVTKDAAPAGTITGYDVYDVSKIANGYNSPAAFATNTSYDLLDDTANAHKYYEKITGEELADKNADVETSGVSSATSITALELTKDVPVKVTFIIWIEGTDQHCFNACGSQNFSVSFKFTAA